MSHAPLTGSGVTTTKYVVPRVSGDTRAAYRIAVAYQDLAEAVAVAERHLLHIAERVSSGWQGPAAHAFEQPVTEVVASAARLVNALDAAADAFVTYAQQLAKAHQHHHWSMSKVLKVGAVAAVSATAIVVTVGAAGAVEAAGAAAAVGGVTQAASEAVVADLVAESALEAAFCAFPALEPILSFVMPQLVQAEWAAGMLAVWDEATTGRLHWDAIAETGGIAFGTSAVASRASGWLEASVWAGGAAVDEEVLEHRIDVAGVGEAFVLARGATFGRDAFRERGWWPAAPDYRRDALVRLLHRNGLIGNRDIAHEIAILRQAPEELERGVIHLRMHEGPGHTIARHIGKSPADLLTRVRGTRIPVASTYWDEATAKEAIQSTLSANAATIKRWSAAGCPRTLRLHLDSPYDVGFAIDRTGKITFVRNALVVLRKDANGVVLVTSFPRG
jgi:hypothetical protein